MDGDVNKKVGLILLAHNLARTLSPFIGGYFVDKYSKFKLIAVIGYVAGKNQDSTYGRTKQGRFKPFQGLNCFLGIICTSVFFYAITTENFAFIITMGILFGFSIFLGFTVMLNLGGEIIYPEPEVTGSTLILMLANGFTFVMAEILSQLTMKYNIIYRLVLHSLLHSILH